MSKGKTSRNETHVNEDLARAGAEQYAMATDIARLGFQPNRGVTIAGFTPQQMAGMQGTSDAARAFGLPHVANVAATMPATDTSATGIAGYSTAPEYDAMIGLLPEGFRRSIDAFFADPNKQMTRTQPVDTRNRGGGKKGK